MVAAAALVIQDVIFAVIKSTSSVEKIFFQSMFDKSRLYLS
jgi:hypothetical protein